jgi:hypothetical protein
MDVKDRTFRHVRSIGVAASLGGSERSTPQQHMQNMVAFMGAMHAACATDAQWGCGGPGMMGGGAGMMGGGAGMTGNRAGAGMMGGGPGAGMMGNGGGHMMGGGPGGGVDARLDAIDQRLDLLTQMVDQLVKHEQASEKK